jgi:hypothetical protein
MRWNNRISIFSINVTDPIVPVDVYWSVAFIEKFNTVSPRVGTVVAQLVCGWCNGFPSEIHYSPSSTAKLEKAWSYTSTRPCIHGVMFHYAQGQFYHWLYCYSDSVIVPVTAKQLSYKRWCTNVGLQTALSLLQVKVSSVTKYLQAHKDLT